MNREEFIKAQKLANKEEADRQLKWVKETSGSTLYELVDNIIESNSTYVGLREPLSVTILWYGERTTKNRYMSIMEFKRHKENNYHYNYSQGYKPEYKEETKEVYKWKWFKKIKVIKTIKQIKRYVKEESYQPTINMRSFETVFYLITDYIEKLGFTWGLGNYANEVELLIYWTKQVEENNNGNS